MSPSFNRESTRNAFMNFTFKAAKEGVLENRETAQKGNYQQQ